MYRWYLADNNDDIPVDAYIGCFDGICKHDKQFSLDKLEMVIMRIN